MEEQAGERDAEKHRQEAEYMSNLAQDKQHTRRPS